MTVADRTYPSSHFFLRARAHNYFRGHLGGRNFKARSADRNADTDLLRVDAILESIENALNAAEQEKAGLSRTLEDVVARAAAPLGNDSDE